MDFCRCNRFNKVRFIDLYTETIKNGVRYTFLRSGNPAKVGVSLPGQGIRPVTRSYSLTGGSITGPLYNGLIPDLASE